MKNPLIYTDNDLEVYKSDRKKIKKGGSKYSSVVNKLFTSSGSRLSMKLQKNNFVYWHNPNELVDRLRLLLACRAAGNTGVSNEIISIFEELRETGLIKRIPNV